jgi:hypothetical protein
MESALRRELGCGFISMNPDSSPDKRDSSAPAGAHCAEHPQRPAHFTCPRCGSYACLTCWHPSVERCQQCLKRDPTEAAPAIPWERTDRAGVARYFATIATALRPIRSAPAFARDDVSSALRFMLLSAVPLALLAGVIPHTRTLLFEGEFQVRVLGTPDTAAIAVDVLRAMGVQLALSAVDLACLTLPFVSLVRAYAPARRHAALRVMLYRGWLMPAALAIFYVAIWMLSVPSPASPDQAPPAGWLVVFVVRAIVPVLLFVAMGSTARLACGLGPFLSIVLVIVPVLLLQLVNPLAELGMQRLLPPMPPSPR